MQILPHTVDTHAVEHIRTRLCAAYRGYSLARVKHIDRPRRLKVDRRAVFHHDKAERRILNGEFRRVPVAPCVALLLCVVQRVICSADTVFRLVVVHRPERKVERVRADVDKGTAALLVFVEEHAPCGHGAAAQCGRLGVVNVAERSRVRLVFDIYRVVALAALIAYRQLLSGARRGVKHFLRLDGVDSHRLFAHNVLARLKCVNGDKAVTAVRSQHMNNVYGFVLEQLFIVGVDRTVGRSELFARLQRL